MESDFCQVYERPTTEQASLKEGVPMHATVFGRSGTPLWRFALVVFLPLLFVSCNKSPTTPEGPAPEEGTFEGSLDKVSAEEIGGWAWDSSQPDVPIKVDIFDGNKKLETVVADIFRGDLVKEKKGNGKHGFSYAPPDSLKDGKSHTIRAKVSGTNQELSSSPMPLKAP
jgi:hypothetical protein